MVTRTLDDLPTVGEVVTVPWGLDDVTGVVEDSYSSGSGPRVRVRVVVAGPDGEELDHLSFVLPALVVRRSEPDAAG